MWQVAAQEVSIESLAQEVMQNRRAQDRDLTEFTYDYEYRYQFFDEKGKPGKRLVEAGETYQSSTRNHNVALSWNGVPDSPKKIEKKRLEAAKRLQADFEQRLKQGTLTGGPGPEYGSDLFGLRMEIFRVLRHCPLSNLRRERLDGRETLVFDYGPAPSPVGRMPQLHQIRGTFWIDAEDRLVRRWDAVIAKGPLEGHPLWVEDFHKVLNRIWLAKQIRFNLNADLRGWKARERVDWEAKFTNHKRFGVEVEQKIGAPPAGRP